jgi:hypothetical protein
MKDIVAVALGFAALSAFVFLGKLLLQLSAFHAARHHSFAPSGRWTESPASVPNRR